MIKLTKMPEVEPEEKIYGFQILLDNYSIDVYFCFSRFKIEVFKIKNECWGVCLGVFNIQGTNHNINF